MLSDQIKNAVIAMMALFCFVVGVHARSLSGELKTALHDKAEVSKNFDAFKRETAIQGALAEQRHEAQKKSDEAINEKTHVAYRAVMDRIDAARLRSAASGDQGGPRGGPLPSPSGAPRVPDGVPAECGLDPEIEARLYNAAKDAAQLELLQQWEQGVQETQEMYR